MENERRNEQRKALNEPAEITFYSNGGLHFGSMLDLSTTGACFSVHLDKSGRIPALAKDGLMDYYVTMTNGTSKCRSRLRWTRRSGDRLLCGIVFVHRAEDEDDPLAMTINRYFRSDNGGNRRYHDVPRIRG